MTMTRLSACWRNWSARTSPIADSVVVCPASSAFVESPSRRRIPGPSAIAPIRAMSVVRPSTGVRSSFQSPECRITPCGVCRAIANAVRHRVGHRDELDVERTDLAPLAVDHRVERRLFDETRLLDATAGHAEGERRAVERERQVAQQVGQRADVVLVAVREHASVDAVRVVAQVGEVGQDQVDARHLDVREHQPAVDQEQPVVDLDDRAVAPDLAESAEERDAYGSGHGVYGWAGTCRDRRGCRGALAEIVGRRAHRQPAFADR